MATLTKHKSFESLKANIKPVKNKKLLSEFEEFVNRLSSNFFVKKKKTTKTTTWKTT
ncbi:hypothetical protein [Niabella ginsenosidivorans]|uniref:hypothetical protein n=1 Tax=Niabella ginsenosidivorans TaxID=1176587 RepID=UPI0012ED7A8E|nr:hypothetical protein [Niabella ginsenosidivorans]